MEQKGLRLEPGETPETRVQRLIEGIDFENEAGSFPAADRVSEQTDPVGWLIARVDAVVIEAAQMGTEPLTTKAGCLASLYQARALEDIARSMFSLQRSLARITTLLEDVIDGPDDGSAIRTKAV